MSRRSALPGADELFRPTGEARPRERSAEGRAPTGRERHAEKITVYVSAEELLDVERARLTLRGVALLIQTIEKVRERLNPDLELEGILATMYDARTLHGREVLARVVEAFGEKVFHTVINRTIRFPETTVAGEPITTYASSSHGATAYRELAMEVLAR